MEAAERELWRRFRCQGDQAARDYLFLRYTPWAKSVARAVARKVRSGALDWSDHAQNANIGLLEAMSRYDVDRGVEFVAYAKPRVRGAVFNGIRAWYRTDHSRATHYSVDRLNSLQTEDETDQLHGFVETVVGLSIGFLLESSAAAPDLLDDPSEHIGVLRDALLDLPDRQRDILISHYFMQVQFQDIASRFGVTKGRISQLHKESLARLREILRARSYEKECFF